MKYIKVSQVGGCMDTEYEVCAECEGEGVDNDGKTCRFCRGDGEVPTENPRS